MYPNNYPIMKIIFQSLSLLVLLLICYLSNGQNNMSDVVYLKNGSIIRGIIIEQVPNQSIKIQTADRNVFVFKYDEIEKIAKENQSVDNSNNSTKVTDFKKCGFINITENNYGLGIGDFKSFDRTEKNQDFSFGIRTVNGYQINNYCSLGIGIGIEKNNFGTFLPITFDARAAILKGQVSPVFDANFGYAITLYPSDAKGGFTINPSFGIRVYISKNVSYILNIGYKLMTLVVTHYTVNSPDDYDIPKTDNFNYQFVTISMGISF